MSSLEQALKRLGIFAGALTTGYAVGTIFANAMKRSPKSGSSSSPPVSSGH